MRAKALSGLLALFLAGSCFVAGRASVTVTQDSTWWGAVADAARPDVVAGMLDAYTSGWADGAVAEGVRITDEGAKLPPSAFSTLKEIVYRKEGDHYASFNTEPKFSRTFAFYSEAITDFYASRSAGAGKITVGDILTCLSDHAQYSCDQIEKFNTP